MRKYIPAVVSIIISAVLIWALVEFEFEPMENLMKPPKVGGENLKIQLAFENAVGGEYRLITPLKGNYRSAYTFVDLDSDGEDEVIVFYSKDTDTDVVRMNILGTDSDGNWYSLSDFENSHSEVQQIEFADINADKIKEIIVGWTVYQNELAKTMNVYMLSNDEENIKIESVYSDTYYDFKIFDVDCDATKDILKIGYETVMDRSQYSAVLLGFDGKEITEKSSILLDNSFSSITSVTSDYLQHENRRRLYFDGLKYESGMSTDCIYWDAESASLKRERTSFPPLGALSSRITNVACCDINDDGIIEVPKEEELLCSEIITESDIKQKQTVIKWIQLGSSESKAVDCRILNQNYGYSFKMDESWVNTVTVVNNLSTGTMTFYKLSFAGGYPERGEALFSVIAAEDDSADLSLDYRYKHLTDNKTFSYYCRIYSGGENMNIAKSDISKLLIFN